MQLHQLAEQALGLFETQPAGLGLLRPADGLLLLRHVEPPPTKATLYEPVVCLILQGRKETAAGAQVVSLGPGDALVVSHDMPVTARITSAEPAAPYLALIVSLDLSMLRGLYQEVGEVCASDMPVQALAAHRADGTLIDALSRYLALASDPVGARVLLPLIRREVHFRLLMAPSSGMLRQLLRHDSHASNVARAIAHLRTHFRRSVSIPALASSVGMSPSALHKHFKLVTSTSPLQYLKELRLLEARRLLSESGLSVSAVAYEVGYESPNQFSREYSRKFGVSPRSDRSAELGA